MTKLLDLYPQNLASEYRRFKADTTYNPQFTYVTTIDQSFLTKWGTPNQRYLDIADHIIEKWQTQTAAPLDTFVYEQAQITEAVNNYFLNLRDVPIPPITFNQDQIARCQVTPAGISFRPYLQMAKEDFDGLLRHEIGSHYLRRLNHKKQIWSEIKNDDLGRTEEGVALLHTYLLHPQPSLIKSALRYKAAWLGQNNSFSQVYRQLQEFGVSDREAWRATLRTKRGLTDTSQPISFTKDIMYLEGIIKVLQWLKKNENTPKNLYQGQVSLEQLKTLQLLSEDKLFLPDFIKNDELYYQQIESLINYNNLGDIL